MSPFFINGVTWEHLTTKNFWWIIWSALRGMVTDRLYILGNKEHNPKLLDGYKASTKYLVVARDQGTTYAFFTRNGYKATLCGWIFNQCIYRYELTPDLRAEVSHHV